MASYPNAVRPGPYFSASGAGVGEGDCNVHISTLKVKATSFPISFNSPSYPQGYSFCATNGEFILKISDGSISVQRSNDGINWYSVGTLPGSFSYPRELTYGNGVWLVSGHNVSGVSRSIDNGVTWSSVITTTVTAALSGSLMCAYGNGMFLRLGQGYCEYSSDGGLTWSAGAQQGSPTALAFGNGIFVAKTTGANITASADGINWWQTGYNMSGAAYRMVYGNDRWVVISANNTTGVSFDNLQTAIENSNRKVFGNPNSPFLEFADGVFYAGQTGGYYSIDYSIDGKVWLQFGCNGSVGSSEPYNQRNQIAALSNGASILFAGSNIPFIRNSKPFIMETK